MSVRYSGSSADAIAFSIESAIRSGELAASEGLPAIRALAGQLEVSPATVAAAYRSLRERGVVETAGRHGTRVRRRSTLTPRSALLPEVPAGVRDVSHGGPDPRVLPGLARHLRALSVRPVSYERVGPLPDVLERAVDRLGDAGLDVPAATFTSGALDGIERVLGAHLAPGDAVGVEDPGWGNLLDLIAAMGLRPIGIPVEDDGPGEAGFGAALAQRVRAVVLTTRAHNPTGARLTERRADRLRSLLASYPEVLVVEDDHSAELSTPGEPVVTLTRSVRTWAYVRSVSKPYGPDLRMATVAGDEDTIARVEGRLRLGPGWVSTMLQRLVATLWDDAAVTRAVHRAGASYAERRDGLVAALTARGVPAFGRTGLNVWVPVPDETTVVTQLRDTGWAVAPGAAFRVAAPPGIRITVSDLDTADIDPLSTHVMAAVDRAGSGRLGSLTR